MNKIFYHIRSLVGFQSIIVWAVVFVILFIQMLWVGAELSLIITFITIISLFIIYYTTHMILVPGLLLKEKKTAYFISSLILIVSLAYICSHLEIKTFQYFKIEPKDDSHFIFSLAKFLALYILSYAISNIIFFYRKTGEDAEQKEKLLSGKKMLEVRVLKSQINSHFIFNALNNIYSMIYFKDKYTSGYVLKLAEMMRYVMEDCEKEFISFSKEIDYIEKYIDFQKLRFENVKDIVFTCSQTNSVNISVPPMLFQPLVENCFKHTPLEVDKESYVHIYLEVSNKQIRFISENSQPILKNSASAEGTGIGVENVKRRLVLYYGNNYTLDISDMDEYYKVELLIRL